MSKQNTQSLSIAKRPLFCTYKGSNLFILSRNMNQKELLQNILDYRKEHDTFKKSLDQRSEKFHIATYDGPPFASGTPHF
jgi:isoleucyl-tRNA synthetase